MFKFSPGYALFTGILFITEVLIALYVHDDFIRPYFGDFLVVILLYTALRSFWQTSASTACMAVLLFAYGIEVLQYFRFVHRIGLGHNKLAKTIIGTGFSWWDMLAYTLGVLSIYAAEKILSGKKLHAKAA